jgi:hypothetical protein
MHRNLRPPNKIPIHQRHVHARYEL